MSQINAVEAPIINSPYDEPANHWHIEVAKQPEKRPGRRLASYFFRVPERAARGRKVKGQQSLLDDASKGEEYLLDLANLIRQRLKDWRARDYAGATKVTRELLELWRSPDRAQRLFFAQLEAVETVLFLVEGPDDLKQGVNVPGDEPGEDAKAEGYKAFLRYALKMATGSGKTTVMGMLSAWSILNKVAQPQAAAYSDTVLIVCPNVTIRDRLRELDPNLDELSLYRTRQLVPLHRMPDLRRGEVFITNWHNLERRELSDVNGTTAKVVKRGVPVEKTRSVKLGGRDELTEADIRQQALTGAFDILRELRDAKGNLTGFEVKEVRYYESDTAFLRRVLGNRKGRSSAILVMNDEAHHAYRRGKLDAEDVFAVDEENRRSRCPRGNGVGRRAGPHQQGAGRTQQRHPPVRGPVGHAILHPGQRERSGQALPMGGVRLQSAGGHRSRPGQDTATADPRHRRHRDAGLLQRLAVGAADCREGRRDRQTHARCADALRHPAHRPTC
jgi:type III restriction enzyme